MNKSIGESIDRRIHAILYTSLQLLLSTPYQLSLLSTQYITRCNSMSNKRHDWNKRKKNNAEIDVKEEVIYLAVSRDHWSGDDRTKQRNYKIVLSLFIIVQTVSTIQNGLKELEVFEISNNLSQDSSLRGGSFSIENFLFQNCNIFSVLSILWI